MDQQMPSSNLHSYITRMDSLRSEMEETAAHAGVLEKGKQNDYIELRRKFFSIQDEKLRIEMIAKYRDLEVDLQSEIYSYYRRCQRDAEQKCKTLEKKGARPPWVIQLFLIVLAVWAGSHLAATPGAIACAIAGCFFGNLYAAIRRDKYNGDLEYAKLNVSEFKEKANLHDVISVFSEQEATTGNPDEHKISEDEHAKNTTSPIILL